MNIRLLALLASVGLATTGMAQDVQLVLPDFTALEHTATESVNITLGPWLLRSAGFFLDEQDPDSSAAKQMLSGVKSVQIRSFEFGVDGAYSKADVDAVRRQLAAPTWTQLLKTYDRESGEDVDIYISMSEEHTNGMALIASGARELTIISISGSIALQDIPKIEKQFHIPQAGKTPAAARAWTGTL